MPPLVVPGTLDSLAAIAVYVKRVAAQADLDPKIAYTLRLAVDEIATNIVTYGYEQTGRVGTISVSAEIDPAHLKLTIEDQACAFDPTQQDLPDAVELSQSLRERPIGGLGLYLAFTGVDDYIYERVGDCNRNTLVIYR